MDLSPPETLLYWIKERYKVYLRKENGFPKPWSDDPVFQRTYFCNVHRENDRITKWIRKFYSPYVNDSMFEYNIVLSRFLNWPDTLQALGYIPHHCPIWIHEVLKNIATSGTKVWGNAYVITTHGIKMPKAQYLCENVLGGLYEGLDGLRVYCRGPRCGEASVALQGVEGIGSFLAGQIVADLKHTKGHPLEHSLDYATFVEPGPGSIRGVSWFINGTADCTSSRKFKDDFMEIRKYVDAHWPAGVPTVDNQDLQNCLCEFDKYMRIKSGTGRSKRGYNGGA